MRAAANNRATQRRIRSREQRDQMKKTDHRDHDRATFPHNGGADSEGDKIAPICAVCGGRQIGEIVD